MTHQLSNVGFQSAIKRMVMWLQKLCAVHAPQPDGSYLIPCSMTLQQISDYLLIHITTCTKLIATLETDGVIERTRTHIRVLRPDQLEAYGLSD